MTPTYGLDFYRMFINSKRLISFKRNNHARADRQPDARHVLSKMLQLQKYSPQNFEVYSVED